MTASDKGQYRLAVDIGGTFTDIVLVASDGAYWTKKVPSTPGDYAQGIIDGVRQLLAEQQVEGGALSEVIHGTTVAINAVLENKGAKTALITTKGFRDVLELRRLRVPQLYSLFYEPPRPLVERRLRLEVDERIGAGGEVVQPLDEATVHAAIERIRQDEAEAVAVCLIHSYGNPDHERRIGEILRRELPGVYSSLSVDVLPEIREYERTSTTVINAYLGPIVKTYLDSLVEQLQVAGIDAPLRIMQSNGGIMSANSATGMPVQMMESGPAAGVVGAQELANRVGTDNVITFDMGGTTAKASLIEDGERSWTTEHEVGGGISLSARLVKGGGHAVKVPVIDLAEVGAGGGSIVWIDSGGALKIGPQSAGAVPGPVCYAQGGVEPTVTDANVVLGYINPRELAGGTVELRPDLAKAALEEKVAGPLKTGVLEAAYGVHTVANISMIRAIKAVSTYRGRDPRDFDLMAFGGSGPVHAAGMARDLGIKRVVVPPAPGLFSAVGLLEAQPEHHFVQTYFSRTFQDDAGAIRDAYQGMEARAAKALEEQSYDASEFTWHRSADLRYVGQAHELTVEVPASTLSPDDLVALGDAFGDEHERTYGHKAEDEPMEIVNLRVTTRSSTSNSRPEGLVPTTGHHEGTRREAYFGPEHGLLPTPVVTRSDIKGEGRRGPLIVEEYDATVLVPPDCTALLDQWHNLVIEIGKE